jgi:hypothetical protein
MWQYLFTFPELYICVAFLAAWLLMVLLAVWAQPSEDERPLVPFDDWTQSWGPTTRFSSLQRDFHQYHMQGLYTVCSEDYASRFARASDKIRL